jgi:hypothetical protein
MLPSCPILSSVGNENAVLACPFFLARPAEGFLIGFIEGVPAELLRLRRGRDEVSLRHRPEALGAQSLFVSLEEIR